MNDLHITRTRPGMEHFFASLILLCFLLLIGGAFSQWRWQKYVERLEAGGVTCERKKTQGPSHTRKLYWVCDNGETVIWWGANMFKRPPNAMFNAAPQPESGE